MPVITPKIYNDFFAIVPNDSTSMKDLGNATEWAIYVGVTGDISLTGKTGGAVIFKAVPAGTILPVKAVKVNATGTTATNLVGLKVNTSVP